MNNLDENSLKYLGYPFSFDFIVKAHQYFNLYYRSLFCKITPLWLKYLSIESINGKFSRCEVEDINYVKYKDLYSNGRLNKGYAFDKFKDFILSSLNYTSDEDSKFDVSNNSKSNLIDNLNVLVCPCLLGVYRSDFYRSFLIFPFYCEINCNLSVSNDLIQMFKVISSDFKLNDHDFTGITSNGMKVGYLDDLQDLINRNVQNMILISVYFNTQTDFTLFEFNFNNSLNYLSSS